MAFDKLTEYSATNASNTSVGDVDVTEGMLPSNVNNAIRELMTHQKEAFGSGTPLYVDQTNNRVGINTVPKSFNTVDGALQIGTRHTLTSFSNDVGIGYNHYYNSGWKYTNTDVARRFSSTSTVPFIWQYAASGSADAAITWTEAMRLDSSGNLLVGKTASGIANNGIELRANDDVLITKDGATTLYLNRKSSDGEIIEFRKDGANAGEIGVVNGNNLIISNNADNSGLQLGSGSITPAYDGAGQDNSVDLGSSSTRFKDGYFSNGITARYHYNIDDPDTYIEFPTSNLIKFFTGGAEKARITASSTPAILVGCTVNPSASAPGSMVSTTGAGSFTSFAAANTASTHAVFGNLNGAVGTIQTTNSTTAYNTSSDRRLKSNIEDAASASDKIDAIQVRQFDWNVDDSHQDYGLIAQELQPIEPLAVTGDADSDEMMGVDYSKLVPMLIKEIQELRGRVAALEAS